MSGTDPYRGGYRERTEGAIGAVVVTPDDDADIPGGPVRAISIGTAGDLRVTMVNGQTETIPANCLAVGVQHAMQVVRVHATGTTAAEIVGWF